MFPTSPQGLAYYCKVLGGITWDYSQEAAQSVLCTFETDDAKLGHERAKSRTRSEGWKTVSGPLPLTFRRTFERVEGGTRVAIRYEGELHGFLKLAGPLVARMGKRQLDGDFPKLKELMEARAL